MIQGTSSIEYGPSLALSSSIVAAMCFSRMRKLPILVRWSFVVSLSSWRPLEMMRRVDRLVPLEGDERLRLRLTSIHFSPGARSAAAGPGLVTVPSTSRIHQPSVVSR